MLAAPLRKTAAYGYFRRPEGGQLVLSWALAGVCDHQRVNAYNRKVLQRLRPEPIAVVDGFATSIEHLQGWLATSDELLEREPEADKLKQALHDGDNECEDLLYATLTDDQPRRLHHLAHTLLTQVDAAFDH